MLLNLLTYLLLFLTTWVAAVPKPARTRPELAKRTMDDTPPNWTPVISAALGKGLSFGLVGQNSWITLYPPVSTTLQDLEHQFMITGMISWEIFC